MAGGHAHAIVKTGWRLWLQNNRQQVILGSVGAAAGVVFLSNFKHFMSIYWRPIVSKDLTKLKPLPTPRFDEVHKPAAGH